MGVYFEKENVNTLFMDNEMIITFMMSQAQAESESLSGNVRSVSYTHLDVYKRQLLDELNMERSVFYDRKREAIFLLSLLSLIHI